MKINDQVPEEHSKNVKKKGKGQLLNHCFRRRKYRSSLHESCINKSPGNQANS